MEDVDLAMRQFRHSQQSNEDLIRVIDNYVNEHGDASLGTIEVELGISIYKQQRLALAYRDRLPLLKYKKGVWSTRLIIKDEVVPVPPTSQDKLTGV